MDNTNAFISDAWAVMKDFIPAKERADAAEQFLQVAADTGVFDIDVDKDEVAGHCAHLDNALNKMSTEGDEEDGDW